MNLSMWSMRLNQLILSSLFCLAGCGYQWHNEFPLNERPVIAVPFISGDEDGSMTQEIVLRLQSSGLARVSSSKGDYRLALEINKDLNSQIGYRRDPQKIKNEIQKNLLAAEQRRTLDVTMTLFCGNTEEIAYGPYKFSVWADYDYVDGDSYQDLAFPSPSGNPIVVLPFSLGQLEELESAKLAAVKPLYRKLAQKIVDVISAEW